MSKRMGYRAALQWLLDNDDCCWLDDRWRMPDGTEGAEGLSISASLVADIFGIDDEHVRRDLLRLRAASEATS